MKPGKIREKKGEEYEHRGFIRGPSLGIGKMSPTHTRESGTLRSKGVKETLTPRKATRVSLPVRSVASNIPENAKLAL